MRRIRVTVFSSIDGVMQAPGGPEEDPTGGFTLGGWSVPYWDDAMGATMDAAMAEPFDLLLGRRTYDIFAAHWPFAGDDPVAAHFNACTKYVATHRPDSLSWRNSVALGDDVPGALARLKSQDGPTLLVQGSSELLSLLWRHDLVDELRLWTFPLVLGRGKRVFPVEGLSASMALDGYEVSTTGVVMAHYRRSGDIRTGSFAFEEPTAAEVARRKEFGGST